MRRIWIQMGIEFKMMRLSKLTIGISMLVLPLAYSLVSVITQPISVSEISFVLSGSMAAALVSSLFGLIVIRTSNLFQPDVLELHASFPLQTVHLILGSWLAYGLVSLPLVSILFVSSLAWAPAPQAWLALTGLAASYFMVAAIASGLGLLVRNPYKAQGIMSLVGWVLVLLAPMNQSASSLPLPFKVLILLNPITHSLNVIRPYLGFEPLIPPIVSFAILGVLGLVSFSFLIRAARRVTMLEKFF